MPTLTDLRNRTTVKRDSPSLLTDSEEVLVADARGRLTPAQIVEQKLRYLLRNDPADSAAPHWLRPRKAK